MTMKKDIRHETILREIEKLERMPTAELRKRWVDLMGTDSGKLGRNYLIRRLAYRIQELAYGGLTREAREVLAASPKTKVAKPKSSSLLPGTRLQREWHGKRYEVVVLEKGYRYDGKEYRSLSAVARTITGSYWSGNRFFGVAPTRRKKRESANAATCRHQSARH